MRRSITAMAVIAAVSLIGAATASAATTLYNSDAGALPGNLPSWGFEATGSSELGGEVQLGGSQLTSTGVRFVLSSWGCESGTWFGSDCVTTAGATFPVAMTATAYNVGPGGAPGSVVATRTKTLKVPYRPSANDAKCTGPNDGKWFKSGSGCFNGKAVRRAISFGKATLPSDVIISLAYNTTHYGYSPIGESAPCYTESGGCGYDSMNIALGDQAPSVGSQPRPDDAWLNSLFGGNYCDGGSGGTGAFRLDAGCWTGYQIPFRVTTN